MRHANGDKIIIATGEDGHAVFFSVHADASGNMIDFVMHRQGGNLGYARKTLRAYTPSSFPTAQPSTILKPRPIPHDRAALAAAWHRFAPYRGVVSPNRRFFRTAWSGCHENHDRLCIGRIFIHRGAEMDRHDCWAKIAFLKLVSDDSSDVLDKQEEVVGIAGAGIKVEMCVELPRVFILGMYQ
jgi:hypothetical protein